MRISYSKGESDVIASGKGDSSSHLTVLAIGISIVFIVIALGLWFGYSQTRQAVESVPEAILPPTVSPEVQKARVYEAIDGITQCHKNTPTITNGEDRSKRQKCYYAVMVIFTASAICDLTTLDDTAKEICRQAGEEFRKEYPKGIPQDLQPAPSISPSDNPSNTNTPSGNQNRNSVSTNSTLNTTSNTNGSGVYTNTNSSNSNTNTTVNANTGTAVASGNTNTSNRTPSGNTNTATNTNQTPPEEICIIDTGEVVLLEHTNNCQ